MTTYKPKAECPSCRRRPPVEFTADEVRKAKRERQAARVLSVQCPRCQTYYWIRARAIAQATANGNGTRPISLPPEFPGRSHLVRAGLTSLAEVRARDDLTDLPGIGPKTAEQIEEALVDISVQGAVA